MPVSTRGRAHPEAATATPRRAQRSPKTTRRRDPLWARLLVGLGALLMMGSGGVIVGGKVLVSSLASSVEQGNLLGNANKQPSGQSINGALNAVLVGIDQRPDSKELIRADSIIILHVPASHDRAYLISIPRDLYVQIPAYPRNKVTQHNDKINAAFALGSDKGAGREGGFELLTSTIRQFTGLRFNAGAIVDFGGFKKMVDALGGVDMCIDQRVVSRHIGYDKNGKYLAPYTGPDGETRVPASTPKVYEPGCRHLAAYEALDYVRQRKGLTNGDYDRQRHQQQFLKAVMKAAKEQNITTNPVKALQLMKAAGSAFDVDLGGVPLEDWIFTLRGVTDNNLTMIKTNAGKVNSVDVPGVGSSEQLTDESREMFTAIRKDKLAEFLAAHPDFESPDIG